MDRITEVTRECFDALIQLRRLEPTSLPPPEALFERLRSSVDALYTRAARDGFGREEANDVAYAVVALADEVALGRSESYREFWAGRSLQLHYFHENVAGEEFFTRLEALRRDPRRREILQAYYVALLLGFQGRYQVRGGEVELLRLVEEVQRELERGRTFDAETLSPHGERPEDSGPASRGPGPWLRIGAGVLVAVVLAYAAMYAGISASAGRVVERVAAARLNAP
jgi:type VI secretion system protein ImpK